MRILITGSDGAVGKEIAYLLKKNNKIELLQLTKNKTKRKNFFYQDLTKPIDYKFKKIDVIVHCAAKNPLSKNGNNEKNIYLVNLKITKNIINFSNKNNIKKIIFLSAMDVYGSINNQILQENYKTINSNLYGKSKLEAEKLFCKKKNKFKAICLRIPGVFISDLTRNRPLIISLIKKIIKNDDLYVYNIEKKFNNIIDPYEIVKFINNILNRSVQSNVYNFSASQPITFIKLINLIKKGFQSKSKVIEKKTNKKSFIISTKKIQNHFKINLATTSEIVKRGCVTILKKKTLFIAKK